MLGGSAQITSGDAAVCHRETETSSNRRGTLNDFPKGVGKNTFLPRQVRPPKKKRGETDRAGRGRYCAVNILCARGTQTFEECLEHQTF